MNSKIEVCQFASQIGLEICLRRKTLGELQKSVKRKLKDIDSVYEKTERSRSEVCFLEVAAAHLLIDIIIFDAESSTYQFMKIEAK